MTNPGKVATREVVELIRASGLCRKDFQFFDNESTFMSEAAIAPRSNCILSSEKLLRAGIQISPVRDALRHALEHWQPASVSQPVA